MSMLWTIAAAAATAEPEFASIIRLGIYVGQIAISIVHRTNTACIKIWSLIAYIERPLLKLHPIKLTAMPALQWSNIYFF
jgi:hypothetical protein